MKSYNLPPLASSLTESIRDIGYSLNTAVADIIDNSISAEAKCVDIFSSIDKNSEIKFAIIGKPIRLVLTNLKEGPPINDILFILGKKNAFLRLNNYINRNR